MDQPAPVAPQYKGRSQKARKARLSVDLWCEIVGNDERAVAHLLNLTVGGFRVVGPSAFPVGREVTLILPASAAEPGLELQAKVRWLHLNPSDGLFELGCQILHPEESATRIERILKDAITQSVAENPRIVSSFTKFTTETEPLCAPGMSSPAELRKALAAEGLARLTGLGASTRPR